MPDLAGFEQSLLSLDRLGARRIILSAAAEGAAAAVEGLIVPSLERIGRDWEHGAVALSQVYMAGRICEALVEELLPPASPQRKDQPRLAVAVLEDHHMLGKRIVCSVLRASAFEVLDYGRAGVDDLVERAQADRVSVLLISTLMLASALRVRLVVEGLRAAGASTKVIVGGAPFRLDDELWAEVGADATGRSAADAVELVARFAERAP